jgi:hypothetical protein
VVLYKFALLLALADLSVEKGDDSYVVLPISTDIAGKLIQYYWRQPVPYPSSDDASVLQQNIGKQAAIVNIVRGARGASMTSARYRGAEGNGGGKAPALPIACKKYGAPVAVSLL